MSEQWIGQGENLLKAIERLASKKRQDRLETINAMLFALNALDRSVLGWREWVQNLGFMARFTEDELHAMAEGLLKSVHTFVEYDVDITKRYEHKLPRIRLNRPKKEKEKDSGIYA